VLFKTNFRKRVTTCIHKIWVQLRWFTTYEVMDYHIPESWSSYDASEFEVSMPNWNKGWTKKYIPKKVSKTVYLFLLLISRFDSFNMTSTSTVVYRINPQQEICYRYTVKIINKVKISHERKRNYSTHSDHHQCYKIQVLAITYCQIFLIS
jgi:hypothetical protein